MKEDSCPRGHSGSLGYTLVELQSAIAVIAVLIGLLIPAVQSAREAENGSQSSSNLIVLARAAQAYRIANPNSPYPGSLPQLAPYVHDPALLTGMENGYYYSISQATLVTWTARAEPVKPGITGSVTFTVDQTGNLTSTPTPGADEARQAMFNQVLSIGASKMAELLKLDETAVQQIRSFVDAPSTIPTVFSQVAISSESGQVVSFSGIQRFNQYPDLLDGFLPTLLAPMQLGTANENVAALPGVTLTQVSETPLNPNMVSYSGICKMTEIYDTKPGIAHSLCAKLSAAQEAEERGDEQAKKGALDAYAHELEAQTDKTLTQHQASVLMTLAKTLY